MKMTRRELIQATGVSAGSIAHGQADAQASSADWAKVSREANQRNAEALARVPVPMATEPAFAFKA